MRRGAQPESARRRPQVLLSVHRPCQRDLESRLSENRLRSGHRRRRLLILVGSLSMNAKQLSTSFVGIILLLTLSTGAHAEAPTNSSGPPDRVRSFNFTYHADIPVS